LMYANDNHGWFPPSQGDDNGTATDEKFLDYGAASTKTNGLGQSYPASRYAVFEQMARYAGYKVPNYDAVNTSNDASYVAPATPIFYCPADDQGVSLLPPWPTNNLLTHTGSTNDGKMRYWWLANPWHQCGNTISTVTSEDQEASGWYWHMEPAPTGASVTTWPGIGPPPWFDSKAAPQYVCVPGYDYLRKTSDKHQSDVAVACCRSKQVSGTPNPNNPEGATYYMHGKGSYNGTTGWKNELFGDGHCESRRSSQLIPRWSQPSTVAGSGPQFW
jgi:hypothetical protein